MSLDDITNLTQPDNDTCTVARMCACRCGATMTSRAARASVMYAASHVPCSLSANVDQARTVMGP